MVDGVEKGPDIEVDHPASRCTISTVRCRALSSNVGIPIRLVVLVPSLGICTRRTGLARALAHLIHSYHIYLVFQCGENSYRIFARQCRKPSLSPWDDFLVRCLRHLSLYKLSTAIGDFPPVGSSGVSSPFLLGLISRLQLLMCHPTALRCLRLSIPCVVTSLRPPARSSSEDRSKIFSATPAPLFFRNEHISSPSVRDSHPAGCNERFQSLSFLAMSAPLSQALPGATQSYFLCLDECHIALKCQQTMSNGK